MNWFKRQIVKAAVAIIPRTYAAAVVNRLTGDWAVTVQSANSEIRASLRNLRARARELGKNNDYIKAFYRIVETNVIGSAGFALQARLKIGEGFDKANNDKIEEAFRDWTKPRYASVDRKFSFHRLLCLAVRTLAQDGEVFIRKVNADNKYGFALQIIDADWFNEQYNEAETLNGNRIVMSIEVDKWGGPVAYHAQNPNSDPYETKGLGEKPLRIPAKEIVHLFIPQRPGQTRGVPWAHTAMLKLNHLYGFEEATVVASRVAASQMGVVTRTNSDATGYIGEGTDAPAISSEVQPGAVMTLPDGFDFKQFNPAHPNTNFGDFVKAMLRGVASGIGVSYNKLANDLENVNYSSIRYGSLEERETWKDLQRFLIEHFLEGIYEEWLIRAVVKGAISLPNSKVLAAKTAVRWRSRGWDWVDPLKDMQANLLALGMGVTTLARIAAEKGEDFEEIIYERKQEVELIKSLGLELNDGTKTTTNATEASGANAGKANKPKSGKPND